MNNKSLQFCHKGQLLIMLLMSIASVHAKALQDEFKEGYIVTNNGDTTRGFVEIVDHVSNSKKCVFKKLLTSDEITYSADQLIAYGTVSGKYFRSYLVETLNVANKKVFIECIAKGRASLFFLSDRYFVEKNSIQELVEVEKEVMRNGKPYLLRQPLFRATLQEAMSDCKDANLKIPSVSLGRKSLVDLFQRYYQCIGADITSIVANRKPFTARFGLSVGALSSTMNMGQTEFYRYLDDMTFDKNLSVVPSIWMEVTRPSVSKRFSFRTGLTYYSSMYHGIIESAVTGLRHDLTVKTSRIELPINFKYSFATYGKGLYVIAGIGFNRFLTWNDQLVTSTYPGNAHLSTIDSFLPTNSFFFQLSGGLGFELPVGKRSVYIEGMWATTNDVVKRNQVTDVHLTSWILTAGFSISKNK